MRCFATAVRILFKITLVSMFGETSAGLPMVIMSPVIKGLTHMSRFSRPFYLVLIILVVMPGCGTKTTNCGDIAGEVKLDGNSIEQGSILFAPIKGAQGAVVGGPIENGRFQLSGSNSPTIGWNRVEIRVPRKTGKIIPKGLGATGEMVEEQVESVASQFNSTSTLTMEIKPGSNTGNFEVTSK